MSQALIDYIDEVLALIELSRLSEKERAEVARYAAHVHFDTYHGPNARGIYGCCIYPTDPRRL